MRLYFTSQAAAEAHVARMRSRRGRAHIERLPANEVRPAHEWQDLQQDGDAMTYASDPHAVVIEE